MPVITDRHCSKVAGPIVAGSGGVGCCVGWGTPRWTRSRRPRQARARDCASACAGTAGVAIRDRSHTCHVYRACHDINVLWIATEEALEVRRRGLHEPPRVRLGVLPGPAPHVRQVIARVRHDICVRSREWRGAWCVGIAQIADLQQPPGAPPRHIARRRLRALRTHLARRPPRPACQT